MKTYLRVYICLFETNHLVNYERMLFEIQIIPQLIQREQHIYVKR